MRNSNAGALSLTRWQYDLLLRWADTVAAPGTPGEIEEVATGPLSMRAAVRREQVLARLDEAGGL
jgi:hypothetical protein